ncbi:MAG: CoA transferase subunit A [Oscillospiraceae bacterium]|nr:CoA transferase subunit A [Oscillospiraceae bacterium]
MKTKTIQEAVSCVRSGMTLMCGGFIQNGAPDQLLEGLLDTDCRELTVIVCAAGPENTGLAKLLAAGRIKKLVVSHIGLNPQIGKMMGEKTLEVQLVPQGTLVEQIRAGGAGLGGFLTPTGIGTEVAQGKDTFCVNGKQYLLELPLRADVALLYASGADEMGNLTYGGTTRNYNTLMAMAADTVVAEVSEITPAGSILPEHVVTPGIFVDMLVRRKAK